MIGQQNFQNRGYPAQSYTGGMYSPYDPTGQQYSSPQQTQTQGNNQAIQYSSVVVVRSEEEAKNYPVGPGISVTFKNENGPYIYTKTMGFNQLEMPIFKKYLLVEEETDPGPKSEVEKLQEQINDLRNLIETKLSKPQSKKVIKEESSE